ncbi:MAG TPA: GNAT family N-acetyltransferase [Armatimonadota bacterium]|nr:GNAT family N-acetyltransferase [Armatimonadota bacterium]
MKTAQLELIQPNRRLHGEKMIDLLAKTFSYNGYFTFRDICRDKYLGNNSYDWTASRIGMIGDDVVTHFGVWRYDMRIGTGRVCVGGIGAVSTHADYRKRGYMEQTAQACLDAQHDLGYDMTILFGIDNFYHRFGYVRAWAESTHTCQVVDLPNERPAIPYKKFTLRPRQDLDDLYNAYYSTATGTAVRPVYAKSSIVLGLPPLEGYLWEDANGVPNGYVIYCRRDNKLDCIEYCGDAEQALRILGVLGRKYHCTEVRFEMMPYNCDLAKRLRRGNCRVDTHYRRCGASMIRTINLRTTMEKLTGELSRRLQASHMKNWHGQLLLADSREQVVLSMQNGNVTIASPGETSHRITGNELAQLIIGTHEPEETVAAQNMVISGDAEYLLPILFPEQHPTLSHLDHY